MDVIQLDPIERVSFTVSAGAVGAAAVLAPAPFALGVAVGAALEAVNLRIQVRTARRMFAGELAGAGVWVGGFGLRFLLMAVGILGALSLGTDPAGLAVGVSLAIPAVVYWAWHNRPAVVPIDPAAALPVDDPSWDRWSVWRAREVAPPEDGADEDAEAHAAAASSVGASMASRPSNAKGSE
jgi:hypothetical protein